ncbi:MAG: cob(I)yrinic acid a,c-diamide adenosyltransferase [Actinomycetota bacterium]|jgi:cob(I)alamin adenosyltransferase|nr:cob(I)yrinic acid a,c-diamide adenosyltransferase [Actinomycetota bacterium]
MRLYTRQGDGGNTALWHGGRVRKDHPHIAANGAIDEAQAFLGLARAEADPGGAVGATLLECERDLWVLMAELASAPEGRARLVAGESAVDQAMIDRLEARIDALVVELAIERAFALPGENRLSACLDVARTVVRRAERLVVGLELTGSLAGAYLNRLSDLCWALARVSEADHRTVHRGRQGRPPKES